MKIARMLSITLLSVFIFVMVTGCGNVTSNKTEITTATASLKETATTTKPAEPVTLTVIDWYSKNELTPAFEAWNKANPDIQLKEEIVDGNNYSTIYTTRFQSGDAPDLIFMGQTPQWIQNGYLMDITDQPSIQYLKDNAPALYNARAVNGKVYLSVIDSSVSIFPIFYNQVIFDNLKLPFPKTMDEFYAVCEKIKQSGVDPLVFGAADWSGYHMLHGTLNAVDLLNQGVMNETNYLVENKITIQQSTQNTFDFIKKLSDGKYISKASATLKYDQSVQYFADGKAAMLPQGTWIPTVEAIKKADPAKFKLNSFLLPVPADPNGKINLPIATGYGIAINAKTKYPEQAKKAFNGITSNDSIKLMCDGMGTTTFIPGITFTIDPSLQCFQDQISASNVVLKMFESDKYIVPSAYGTMKANAATDIILNGITVQKAQEEIQKEWNSIKDSIKAIN